MIVCLYSSSDIIHDCINPTSSQHVSVSSRNPKPLGQGVRVELIESRVGKNLIVVTRFIAFNWIYPQGPSSTHDRMSALKTDGPTRYLSCPARYPTDQFRQLTLRHCSLQSMLQKFFEVALELINLLLDKFLDLVNGIADRLMLDFELGISVVDRSFVDDLRVVGGSTAIPG